MGCADTHTLTAAPSPPPDPPPSPLSHHSDTSATAEAAAAAAASRAERGLHLIRVESDAEPLRPRPPPVRGATFMQAVINVGECGWLGRREKEGCLDVW